jgi:ParB-like chromosome segregation protein Spo0J
VNRKFHPIAELFPMMEKAKLDELAQDIKENGLEIPILIHQDGRIVDGRNRYLACKAAGVKCEEEIFVGTDDQLLHTVVSRNLHRRHLDEGQLGMVAAKLATMGRGRPSENPLISGISQPQAAEIVGVKLRTVQYANHVKEAGVPELVEAVEKGNIAVSRASTIAKEAPVHQERRGNLKSWKKQSESERSENQKKQKKMLKEAISQPKRQKRNPIPKVDYQGRTPEMNNFMIWLERGNEHAERWPDPEQLIKDMRNSHTLLREEWVHSILRFLHAYISIAERGREPTLVA